MTKDLQTPVVNKPCVNHKVSPIKTLIIGLPKVQDWVTNIGTQMESANWKPEAIIGIVKGGAVPATLLSHQLGQPTTLYLTPQQARSTLQAQPLARILVIDDICDSGHTFSTLGCTNENHKCAALIENTDQAYRMDFSGSQISRAKESAWFEFFWETSKSSRRPGTQNWSAKSPQYPASTSLSLTLQMLGTQPDLRDWFIGLWREPSLIRRQAIHSKAKSILLCSGTVEASAILCLMQTRIFEATRTQLIDMHSKY